MPGISSSLFKDLSQCEHNLQKKLTQPQNRSFKQDLNHIETTHQATIIANDSFQQTQRTK